MARILLVEDEPQMQRGLRDNLEIEGYDVEIAADGQSGMEKMLEGSFDLVILDVMLPKKSGFDVLKAVREKGTTTPVIMLTAKGEEIDKVLGLELGADDYVTKPFSLRELLARVKAILRRAEGSLQNSGGRIVLGTVEVDFGTYTATRKGKTLEMTPRELDVLRFLWQHRNRTVTRDRLLTEVWGLDESVTTRTVDNFVMRLRQKIEADPSHPKHIITIHGAGYKLLE